MVFEALASSRKARPESRPSWNASTLLDTQQHRKQRKSKNPFQEVQRDEPPPTPMDALEELDREPLHIKRNLPPHIRRQLEMLGDPRGPWVNTHAVPMGEEMHPAPFPPPPMYRGAELYPPGTRACGPPYTGHGPEMAFDFPPHMHQMMGGPHGGPGGYPSHAEMGGPPGWHPMPPPSAGFGPMHRQARRGSRSEEHCQRLGVQKGASDEEIRKSYLQLVRRHHPDAKGNLNLDKAVAEGKFREIHEAYEALSPRSRGAQGH